MVLPTSAGTRDQIKSRRRFRGLAEAYTHERACATRSARPHPGHVSGTLAAVDIKFLEPACGSGHFLVEVLAEASAVGFSAIRDREQYEQLLVRALASIYAVDICAGNVVEAKSRLRQAIEWHYTNDGGAQPDSPASDRAVEEVLRTNVLHADMLQDAGTTEVVDYRAEGTLWRL